MVSANMDRPTGRQALCEWAAPFRRRSSLLFSNLEATPSGGAATPPPSSSVSEMPIPIWGSVSRGSERGRGILPGSEHGQDGHGTTTWHGRLARGRGHGRDGHARLTCHVPREVGTKSMLTTETQREALNFLASTLQCLFGDQAHFIRRIAVTIPGGRWVRRTLWRLSKRAPAGD